MTYHSVTATFEEGTVVLPPDVDWPNGIKLRIEPIDEDRPTVWEVLERYDGIANDLPEDLAANIDHYVHGHPKK